MGIFRGTGGTGEGSQNAFQSVVAQNAAIAEAAGDEAVAAQAAAESASSVAQSARDDAQAAEAAALAAQAAAEAALNSFDDVYLGAKSTAPATDNDGNALQIGAVYWDTVENLLFVWDGSAWNAVNIIVERVTDLTDVDDTGIANNEGLAWNSATEKYEPAEFYIKGSSNFTSVGIDDNATSTAITIDSSERVGVGTASPENTIDVRGEVQLGAQSAIGLDLYNARSSIPGPQNHGYIATVDAGAGGANGDLVIAPRTSAAASVLFVTGISPSERVRIDGSGNVGIATSTPGFSLHVNGNIRGDNCFLAETTDQAGTVGFEFGSTNGPQLVFGGDTSSFSGAAIFRNSSGEAVRIASDGKVGIGTITPDAMLHVSEGAENSGVTLPSVYNTVVLDGSAPGITLRVTGGDFSAFNFANDNGSTDCSIIVRGSESKMRFHTGNTERMRIDDSGNVGIGITSPARPLHLSGGGMRFEPQSAAPSSPSAGDVYYDSDDDKLKCYNGSTWNNLF